MAIPTFILPTERLTVASTITVKASLAVPYAHMNIRNERREMVNWCRSNEVPVEINLHSTFPVWECNFKTEEDAVKFTLRWG